MFGGIVRGKISSLRTPTEADLPAVNAWLADMRVRRGGSLWEEPASLASWKERLKEAGKDQHAILWIIEANGRAAGLARIEPSHEAGVRWPIVEIHQLIVDPDAWGRGIGSDAALALHRYLFDYLDMRVCAIELPADNERALRIATKLGYQEFGRGHDVYYRDGTYVDQVSLRFDRTVWDERWGATEREYQPSPGRADRGAEAEAEVTRSSTQAERGALPGARSE